MSFKLRVAVSCCLIAGLLSGCASGKAATPGPDAHVLPPHDRGTIVTSDDMDRTPTEPVEKTLAAKVSGLRILQNRDGSISIRIRGTTSIIGGNEPLYIVDGIQVLPGPNGGLNGINPRDIASIEVLKDAATAFYGVRGANGVILIKTKQQPVQ